LPAPPSYLGHPEKKTPKQDSLVLAETRLKKKYNQNHQDISFLRNCTIKFRAKAVKINAC
jgi:hypothetical protein